jgi:hypothetical protein
MRLLHLYIVMVLMGLCCASCRTTHTTPLEEAKDVEEELAKTRGWFANLRLGREIVQELTKLSPEKLARVKVSAYRGERVAFMGVAALPGASNDLFIRNGYYLRVLNPAGKDLRPRSVWWEVMVCGRVLQVLPKNKIIVIQVNEEDWQIFQTG